MRPSQRRSSSRHSSAAFATAVAAATAAAATPAATTASTTIAPSPLLGGTNLGLPFVCHRSASRPLSSSQLRSSIGLARRRSSSSPSSLLFFSWVQRQSTLGCLVLLAALFVLYSLFSLKTKSWTLHNDWQQRQEPGTPRWKDKQERSADLQVRHPAEAGEVVQLQSSPGVMHEKSNLELVNSLPPPPPPPPPAPPPLPSSPIQDQLVDEDASPFAQSPLANVDMSWPIQEVGTQQPSAHEHAVPHMPAQHGSLTPQEKSESSTASPPLSSKEPIKSNTTTIEDLWRKIMPPRDPQGTETAAHRKQVLIPKLDEKTGPATTAAAGTATTDGTGTPDLSAIFSEMQSARTRAGEAAKEVFVRRRGAVVAIAIERETAAALTLEKAAMREKRQRARIKAVVKHEYEALQRDLIVLEEAVAAAAAAETETRDGGDDGAIDDQAGLSPLAVLIGESIAIRSAHDAARMSLAEALLQNNTGSFAEDGGLLQVTSTDVHSSELAVVALATPLDNWEQAKAATAYREEFERVCKRGGTTGEPEDSIRAVVPFMFGAPVSVDDYDDDDSQSVSSGTTTASDGNPAEAANTSEQPARRRRHRHTSRRGNEPDSEEFFSSTPIDSSYLKSLVEDAQVSIESTGGLKALARLMGALRTVDLLSSRRGKINSPRIYRKNAMASGGPWQFGPRQDSSRSLLGEAIAVVYSRIRETRVLVVGDYDSPLFESFLTLNCSITIADTMPSLIFPSESDAPLHFEELSEWEAGLPFEAMEFDLVVINSLLEYIPHNLLERVIDELARVARFKVVLLLATPELSQDFGRTADGNNDLENPFPTGWWLNKFDLRHFVLDNERLEDITASSSKRRRLTPPTRPGMTMALLPLTGNSIGLHCVGCSLVNPIITLYSLKPPSIPKGVSVSSTIAQRRVALLADNPCRFLEQMSAENVFGVVTFTRETQRMELECFGKGEHVQVIVEHYDHLPTEEVFDVVLVFNVLEQFTDDLGGLDNAMQELLRLSRMNVFFLIEACGQTTLEVNCRARRNAFVKTIKPMSWWQAYINRFLVIDTSELTATVLSDAEPDAMPRDVIVAKRPGLGARG